MNDSKRIELVLEYHERSKHYPGRYAPSLGYLDWENQPNPFRHYEGAKLLSLDRPALRASPPYDEIFRRHSIQPLAFARPAVSGLFYDSLALSAWKRIAGSEAWGLRVNPSSGNLHPTEAYLVCGPIDGLSEEPGIYHYTSYFHALERIKDLHHSEWNKLAGRQTDLLALIVLTSIYWRESWKYGERAFRYCHHDAGHAIAAITFAAASAGWETRLISSATVGDLRDLLGLPVQIGPGSEHPDCLLALSSGNRSDSSARWDSYNFPREVIEILLSRSLTGTPNELSLHYHSWPIIDVVIEACSQLPLGNSLGGGDGSAKTPSWAASRSGQTARQIFHRRRSAVAMDGITSISKEAFFGMLGRCSDTAGIPSVTLSWKPLVALAIFVHRVNGLQKGLYMLVRARSHEEELRQRLNPKFLWRRPDGSPDQLQLYLLETGDYEDTARNVSCYQDIASLGAFSLGMIARFEAPIRQLGPGVYPRLYWETGLIGQLLYLEAEARGVRATGIGCFHDDMVHTILGIKDRSWQSLYHFTVGGSLQDPRLETVPPYKHLEKNGDHRYPSRF